MWQKWHIHTHGTDGPRSLPGLPTSTLAPQQESRPPLRVTTSPGDPGLGVPQDTGLSMVKSAKLWANRWIGHPASIHLRSPHPQQVISRTDPSQKCAFRHPPWPQSLSVQPLLQLPEPWSSLPHHLTHLLKKTMQLDDSGTQGPVLRKLLFCKNK